MCLKGENIFRFSVLKEDPDLGLDHRLIFHCCYLQIHFHPTQLELMAW